MADKPTKNNLRSRLQGGTTLYEYKAMVRLELTELLDVQSET